MALITQNIIFKQAITFEKSNNFQRSFLKLGSGSYSSKEK